MIRLLFSTALLLGAIAVAWMGSIFFAADALAFTVTVVIGCVYSIGIIELFQFRRATLTLSQALSGMGDKIAVFDEWLDKLDPSIRSSVRMRVEGERVGLPAPVLTPYLVGLLVMLGLLGTFVGMVDTLKGAVSALEGTTELLAIRAGLAAPIKGLGLAFGTSVAGVATSAMLGLMSTLSRRDRMVETRRLDTGIASVLQEFSLVHAQREIFKALQIQTRALPDVADKLEAMADNLNLIGEKLITNQEMFHLSVRSNYLELATSIDRTHKESLVENVRLAGDSIKPVVKKAMAGITEETEKLHNFLTRTASENFQELGTLFTATSEEVTRAWRGGLEAHNRSNDFLIKRMTSSLDQFKGQFVQMIESMLESFNKSYSDLIERQGLSDRERLDLWVNSLEQSQRESASHLMDASKKFTDELRQVVDGHKDSFETTAQEFRSISSSLTSQWTAAGEYTRTAAESLHSEMAGMVKRSGELIDARIKTEESWLAGHNERIDTFTTALKAELGALRDDEELRGQAAVERLTNLEFTLASHLATLGKELEEPMTRLIQLSSKAPQAAAEVLIQLRQEVSKSIERDNGLMEEHHRIIEELDKLTSSMALASINQREAVEQLVDSSRDMLEDVGRRFTDHVGSEMSQFSGVAESFAGSAVEMASLGDAFSTAINLFNQSNRNLIENLARIEESLEKSTVRSDEQLGYYVAQAREIIDHCMLSQKEIFEELQQLSGKNNHNVETG